MEDTILERWARVLVHHSVGVKKGQVVRLSGPPEAEPLMAATYAELLRVGAKVIVRCVPESCSEIFCELASEEQMDWLNPTLGPEVDLIDASINISAALNPSGQNQIDPQRLARIAKPMRPVNKVFYTRAAANDDPASFPGVRPLRWTTTQYPTPGHAQQSGMSFRAYQRFVVQACHLDEQDPLAWWQAFDKKQQAVADQLSAGKEVHIQSSEGTDLRVNIEGMKWFSSAGCKNLPDGEVYSGPNLHATDGGVNGVAVFPWPTVYQGTRVSGVKLRFENGKVVEATAQEGDAFLKKMIAQDEGACKVGEIAFSFNNAITYPVGQILFDEKIGGSFHVALGAGYPETGNVNPSSLHWDLVGDLREGGKVLLDGEVIAENGKFTRFEQA